MLRLSWLPAVIAVCLAPWPVWAAPCGWGVSQAANQALYARVEQGISGQGDCTLGDQAANHGVVEQGWQRDGQTYLLHWSARACSSGQDARLQPVDLPALAVHCPQTAQRLTALAEAPDWPRADPPKPDDHDRLVGRDFYLVLLTAVLQVAGALGLLLWLWRARRRPDVAWAWPAAVAVTALAVLVRVLVPSSLSNWYTPVLTAQQVPRAELYGAGHVALQWLLRSLLPWSDTWLFAANIVLGSLTVPLWFVVLRQRAVAVRTAALAAGWLAVLPLHVRLTTSASEHVLAAFAWLAALAAWQGAVRGQGRARAGLAVLAMVWATVAALTRLDASASLAALALWPMALDHDEPPQPGRQRWVAVAAWLGFCAILLGAILPLIHTAVADRNTPVPSWDERWLAVRDAPLGLWHFTVDSPGWLGPLVGLTGLAGTVWMVWRRPWLLAVLVATFLLVPAALGRSTFDFIMMRYYLPVVPLLTLPGALLLERFTVRRWVVPVLLGATLLLGGPALSFRYAFQDEYDWLREAVEELPNQCTLAQIPVADSRARDSDVDCCLDVARSPLQALRPDIVRVTVKRPEDLIALTTQAGPDACIVYYEGAVCGLQPTPELMRRRPSQFKAFQAACGALHDLPGWTTLRTGHVAPNSHFPAFGESPVPVRLLRWTPPGHSVADGLTGELPPNPLQHVAWWLLALLPGLVVGWLLRRTSPLTSRWPLVVLPVALPVLAALAALGTRRVGALDAAAMAWVGTLAALAVGHVAVRWRAWLLAGVTLLAALGLLEVVVRVALPPPPGVQVSEARLVPPRSPRTDGQPVPFDEVLADCALRGTLGVDTSRCLRLSAVPTAAPFIVHLGDSMVYGPGARADASVAALSSRLLPAWQHLNAGVPGSGLDLQVLLLQRILAVAKPALVVAYVMPGNDLDDTGRPLESCDGQPPLTLVNGLPRLQCPTAAWQSRPMWRSLLYARLPLPLVPLLPHSVVLRLLEAAHQRAVAVDRPVRSPESLLATYREAVTALQRLTRDAGVPLQLVVMPLRRSQFGPRAEVLRRDVLAVLRDAGLAVVDSQSVVDAWVAARGEEAVFVADPPGDIHLNADAVGKFTEWLAPSLQLPEAVTPGTRG